jgi:hypothetical protein
MAAEVAPSAALRLARAFAGLVAAERVSRAIEALLIGASCAWVLDGLARFEGGARADAAQGPAALAGALAAASWMIERWRDRQQIAARADRVLATPQLFDTALGVEPNASGWSELLACRALARFDRTRLWLAAAPAWTATAALVLLAAGSRELLVRGAPPELAPAPLAGAWSALAEPFDALARPGASAAATAHSELAAELRAAAGREARGELGGSEARALLERAGERLAADGPAGDSALREAPGAAASLAALGRAYERPAARVEAGSEAASAGAPSSSGGSGVPPGGGEGTMGGSTESGPVRLPAPPGPGAGGGEGALRPTLPARWWPRAQDGLVEAWIARQQHPRSKR